jgi:hypothetical protein
MPIASVQAKQPSALIQVNALCILLMLIWARETGAQRRRYATSASGQTEKNSVRAYVFRFALELGHRSMLRRNPFRPFLADFIEARVRLRERRHIKVCEGSIASVAGVTVVDRTVAQR